MTSTQIVSTSMACVDERVTQQEQQYFQALETAGQFELTDDRLTIWYDDGNNVLNFIQAASSTPAPTTVPPTSTLNAAPTVTPPDDEASAGNPTRIVFETELNTVGTRTSGIYPSELDRYVIFGDTIHSPCDGTITEVVDGLPDNIPPATDREHPAGNHVVIACQDAEVVLAHMKEDSVLVQEEEMVTTGQPLGQVGNSGNTTEPHQIFADHPTAAYIEKIREVRFLTPDVAVLRAVVGMVPPGQSNLNPAANAIQTIIAVKHEDQWRIALFQNTPAQFHGRPELAEALTEELQQLL